MLFGEDLDLGEEVGETGAVELVGLLFHVALGDEDEAVAGGEVGEGEGDGGQEFDLLIGDGLGEADDALVAIGGDGAGGELLEAGDEGVAKALKAIAALGDGLALDGVEVFANLSGGVDAVVEVGDEGGDGALEVDVVLPEGVVGVEEEGLSEGTALGKAGHSRSYSDGFRWRRSWGARYVEMRLDQRGSDALAGAAGEGKVG